MSDLQQTSRIDLDDRTAEQVGLESELRTMFDAVVMLTWSNWKAEPRSNRYHYASRFSRIMPVFFVQPDAPAGNRVVEETELPNLYLVHLGQTYDDAQRQMLDDVLARHGVRHPLLWVYNIDFYHILTTRSNNIIVYHATEAYFDDDSNNKNRRFIARLLEVLDLADLVISVSEGVRDSYLLRTKRVRGHLVLQNGCDFEFWRATGASYYEPQPSGRPVALYQGGINRRLDYNLIDHLVKRMPDWDFWFCGRTDGDEKWEALLGNSNVKYLGELDSTEIAAAARNSSVGIIPFLNVPAIRISLPLKAYEYVACGLPVVTVPIDALARRGDLFGIASTPDEFVTAIRAAGPSRTDPTAILARQAAAATESYDSRFRLLLAELKSTYHDLGRKREKLNILVLYDPGSTHVGTIKEHLEAFHKHSRHNIYYLPSTVGHTDGRHWETRANDLSSFDAAIVHYSVRLSLDEHIDPKIASTLKIYSGEKLLFIQDEYERTETARKWIETIGFDVVYTCIPEPWIEHIYPRARFRNTVFVPTLTGYAPEPEDSPLVVPPMAARQVRIAYRGRDLPHHYGDLAREKYTIGLEVRRHAEAHGVSVDIEVNESARIYGDAWYEFLSTARATLGTESGSNVFDFDGRLADLARKLSRVPYEKFHEEYLAEHEGPVRMNQISPKIFEAVSLRTGLILFEGEYSGILRAGVHYIPLKSDFSNIEDVFRKLEDVDYMTSMTERAHAEIIGSGAYSYKKFIRSVDKRLEKTAIKGPRAKIYAAPAFIVRGGRLEKFWNAGPGDGSARLFLSGFVGDAGPVAFEPGVVHGQGAHGRVRSPAKRRRDTWLRSIGFGLARSAWHMIPWACRRKALHIGNWVKDRL